MLGPVPGHLVLWCAGWVVGGWVGVWGFRPAAGVGGWVPKWGFVGLLMGWVGKKTEPWLCFSPPQGAHSPRAVTAKGATFGGGGPTQLATSTALQILQKGAYFT
jgi:hypothetical protein